MMDSIFFKLLNAEFYSVIWILLCFIHQVNEDERRNIMVQYHHALFYSVVISFHLFNQRQCTLIIHTICQMHQIYPKLANFHP